MMQKSVVIALLTTAAVARPQFAHRHHHHHPSGSAGIPSGTGAPYGFGNNTAPFANSTGTAASLVSTATSTSTSTDAVTVTVIPLPVSTATSSVVVAASSVDANNQAATGSASAGVSAATCVSSQSTTTVTSVELVTVTLDESSTTAAASSTSEVASASSQAAGQFYGASSSSASSAVAAASTSYVTSTVAPSSTQASSSTVSPAALAASSTSSTSSAASAVASSSSGTSSSSKRGLAYNDVTLTELWSGKPVSWAYNWADTAGGTVGADLEYVPMAWCPTSITKDSWTTAANESLSSGSSHLLSFNEPDQVGQCSITAAAAATGHIDYMNQFSGRASIGSPAVTNGGGEMGLTFLSNFFTACAGNCKVDFLNIHWYGSGSGAAEDLKNHVTDAITLAQQNNISKVWLTEFALNDASAADTATFLADVLPWLDSNSSVERYAFFMCSEGLLVDSNAISSQIGAAYVA